MWEWQGECKKLKSLPSLRESYIKYLNWMNQKLSIYWQYLEICKQTAQSSLEVKNGCL